MSKEKRKFIVTLPWRKDQQAGETFEAETLHPSLAGHVREIGNQGPSEADQLAELRAELEQAKAELEQAKAAQAKAEKALKDLQEHRAENPALDLQVATPAKAEEPKPKK